MPRYYLHLRNGEDLLEDFDGSVLPNLDAARAEALAGAREILAEKLKAGEVLDGQRFEIADEAGVVLAIVPLKSAYKLP